jgi:hypothetical protein
MDVETRLARLESENRRLRVGVLLALSVVGATFIMGQARPPANLPAEKFSLVRPGGGVLSQLGSSNGKPWLTLYDSATEETNDRANMAVDERDGAAVWVRGHGNDGGASLWASRDGQGSILVRDTSGRIRILMTVSPSTQEPRIEMIDQAGAVIWSAP